MPANKTIEAAAVRRGVLARFLDIIEVVGNKLPDQVTIFVILAAATLILSALAHATGLSVTHPRTGEPVHAVNLLSREGLQWVFRTVVPNFTGFAPLGTVLSAMIGVGVAEKTGLFAALLKALVTAVPRGLITPTVVLAGVLSNVASDAGYIILPPLAAMLYASIGKHPLAGIAAAFAGVAAGFSANLLLSTLDPMLAGLTQQAAQAVAPDYTVNAACNYYFLALSTPFLALVGWFVSVRFVEPRLGTWRAEAERGPEGAGFEPLTQAERRGLLIAGLAFALTIAAVAALVVPEAGVLRSVDPQAAGIARYEPFLQSLVGLILIVFLVPGLAYGIATRQIRDDRDTTKMMSQTIGTMGHYIVMAFFAGQFIAWFNRSNLGLIIAVGGAEGLKAIHLTGLPLMLAIVLFVAVFNLLISSASAKWAILAPIFVPMLMALGKSPENTQALYRVGDSVTNVITPLNVYFPILLGFAHRYVPTAGMGTLIAAMIPYSLCFLIAWTALLTAWVTLGWSLGPGAPLYYP
jgi:aminobenzoyl-glutamate transport protein